MTAVSCEKMSDRHFEIVFELSALGRFQLVDVERVIESEIRQGLTRNQVALTYAMGMISGWPTDWDRVNRAIISRWPKGLEWVKTTAWKLVEETCQPTTTTDSSANPSCGSLS